MRLSTRNTFTGTIQRIKRGPVSTEVTIHVAAAVEIVSVITAESAKRLKLKKGLRAHAIIKAGPCHCGRRLTAGVAFRSADSASKGRNLPEPARCPRCGSCL
jgi:molybdopterin-binding protein